jgi:xylulose-5-phosphate/fructose-6-phosphate phosphoketolase
MDTAVNLHSPLTDDELRRLDAYWRADYLVIV